MRVGNFVLLSQATTYFLAFGLSLCLIIPLCFHLHDFRGHCLLFSTGRWQETDGQLIVNWANSAYCDISIFVGSLLLIVSFIQFWRMADFLFRGVDSTFLSAFIDTIIGLLCMSIIFSVALIITLGMNVWCETMTLRFSSCLEATMTNINKNITASEFFIQVGTAQFSAWASWVIWVGVTVMAVVKICRYHQEENIMVSMARERKRLVNEIA